MLELLAVSVLLNVGLSQAKKGEIDVGYMFAQKHLRVLNAYPPKESEVIPIMKRIKQDINPNRTKNDIFYSEKGNVGEKLRQKLNELCSKKEVCILRSSDFADGVVRSNFDGFDGTDPLDCQYAEESDVSIEIGYNMKKELITKHLNWVNFIKNKIRDCVKDVVEGKVDNQTKNDNIPPLSCKTDNLLNNTNSTEARRKRAPCSGDAKTVTCTPDPCVDVRPVNRSVCDFGKDFCDWSRAPGSTFNFKRVKGPTDMAGKTGPTADRHGSLTGYYIYADASDNMGKIATLRSPNFPAGNYCVEFYYHMFGVGFEGSLQLMMYSSKTAPQSVFTRTSSIGNKWNLFLANLNANALGKEIFHFEFKARIGKSYTSDIAIDDISITKGRCLK